MHHINCNYALQKWSGCCPVSTADGPGVCCMSSLIKPHLQRWPLCLEYQFGNWTVLWNLHSKCLSGHGTGWGVTWLIGAQENKTTLYWPGLKVLGDADSDRLLVSCVCAVLRAELMCVTCVSYLQPSTVLLEGPLGENTQNCFCRQVTALSLRWRRCGGTHGDRAAGRLLCSGLVILVQAGALWMARDHWPTHYSHVSMIARACVSVPRTPGGCSLQWCN